MESTNPTIWRLNNENHWLLFNNNHVVLPSIKEEPAKPTEKEKTKKDKKETNTPFYFAKIKAETKGSLVYTPKGYGIVQAIKTDQNMIAVKVNNEISDYQRQEVTNEIPICLTFITNSGKREDKTILPIHSTGKDVVERIESEQDGEAMANRIFFQGKELNKTNETLEKMGVAPFSKFLIISALGKPLTVTRFPSTYQGWGYSSSSIDGVAFSASRDIRVIGFGIYTPDNDVVVLGTAKFIQGNDAKGTVIYTREVSVAKNIENPEDKVYKLMFNRPVKVKAGENYTALVEMKNGNTHYGSSGNSNPTGEGDVMFTFIDCLGSTNGTGPGSGQIPEIYYYV